MRRFLGSLCAAWLAVVSIAVPSALANTGSAAIDLAIEVLDQLDAGQYAAVFPRFTPEVQAAIGHPDNLGAIWAAMPQQFGPAIGRGQPVTTVMGAFQVVIVPLYFERATMNTLLSIDSAGRIAGLQMQPGELPPPPPISGGNVIERDLTVGQGERALPGTLTLPAGPGPFPAVVLVHGSGPQDRNETLGPNRPFLDIARGLAAQGIAVLRYDKRTYARPQEFTGEFTIDDETTNDAVAALAALRAVPEVDAGRVFVFGHSLGATLAPRIAARAEGVAGVILFAAPGRPLLDLMVVQILRNATLDGVVSPEERQEVDVLSQQIARLRAGENLAPQDSPFGLPAVYWRSIEAVNPVADLQALTQPALLLHGGRDIQVFEADWQVWWDSFIDNPRVTLRYYPALNHLGIAGEGPGSLADYGIAGTVDGTFISDIAAWIRQF